MRRRITLRNACGVAARPTFVGLAVSLVFACPAPPAAPVAPKLDDTAVLVHKWTVAGHALGTTAVIGDADAAGFDGRVVEITPTGYATPWHGTCESATRERRTRTVVDVATAQHVDRAALRSLGLTDDVVEYRLTCRANARAPELAMWIADTKAITCWNGVCYALTR